jgi:hypothetical protein
MAIRPQPCTEFGTCGTCRPKAIVSAGEVVRRRGQRGTDERGAGKAASFFQAPFVKEPGGSRHERAAVARARPPGVQHLAFRPERVAQAHAVVPDGSRGHADRVRPGREERRPEAAVRVRAPARELDDVADGVRVERAQAAAVHRFGVAAFGGAHGDDVFCRRGAGDAGCSRRYVVAFVARGENEKHRLASAFVGQRIADQSVEFRGQRVVLSEDAGPPAVRADGGAALRGPAHELSEAPRPGVEPAQVVENLCGENFSRRRDAEPEEKPVGVGHARGGPPDGKAGVERAVPRAAVGEGVAGRIVDTCDRSEQIRVGGPCKAARVALLDAVVHEVEDDALPVDAFLLEPGLMAGSDAACLRRETSGSDHGSALASHLDPGEELHTKERWPARGGRHEIEPDRSADVHAARQPCHVNLTASCSSEHPAEGGRIARVEELENEIDGAPIAGRAALARGTRSRSPAGGGYRRQAWPGRLRRGARSALAQVRDDHFPNRRRQLANDGKDIHALDERQRPQDLDALRRGQHDERRLWHVLERCDPRGPQGIDPDLTRWPPQGKRRKSQRFQPTPASPQALVAGPSVRG